MIKAATKGVTDWGNVAEKLKQKINMFAQDKPQMLVVAINITGELPNNCIGICDKGQYTILDQLNWLLNSETDDSFTGGMMSLTDQMLKAENDNKAAPVQQKGRPRR